MAMTRASSPVELGPGAAVRTHVPAAARTAILSRAPVIVSHPGSAMTRPNGIVAGTPRERFDLDVARAATWHARRSLSQRSAAIQTWLATRRALEAQGLWESIFAAAPMTRPSPQ